MHTHHDKEAYFRSILFIQVVYYACVTVVEIYQILWNGENNCSYVSQYLYT